jgi:diguanylate cyclase (GGDEF)-like protein
MGSHCDCCLAEPGGDEMHLDVFTVLVASCAIVLMLGLQFIFFWAQDRRSGWLAWWSLPFLAGAVGTACFMMREGAEQTLTVSAGNAASIAAFALVWQATRVFERRKVLLWPVFMLPVGWMLLAYWPLFTQSLSLRVVISSLIVSALTSAAAYELWRGRQEVLASRRMMLFVFGSFTLCFLARIPLVNVLPFPLGGLEPDATALGIFNLLIFIHGTSAALLMVAMTKERLESEQRGFALCDPLTGLLNRRAFLEQSKRMARRRRFGKEPLGLLVLDLDHFKTINDRYGHGVGDRVLSAFAEVAQASIRPTDFIYRMGGEEFCCLLPDATLADAFGVAERIRKAFEALVIDGRGGEVRATVSIGVASSEQMGHDLDAMYGSADAAVYSAKARGRNMSVVAASTTAMRVTTSVGATKETGRAYVA